MTAAAVLNPLDHPDAYDVMSVGGVVMPGQPQLGDISRALEWDKKPAKGKTGGNPTLKAKPLQEFTVDFEMWESAQAITWATLVLPMLRRATQDEDPQALELVHPYLADLDIEAATVVSYTPVRMQAKGKMVATIRFLESRRPRAAEGTPTKAKGGGGGIGGGGPPPGGSDITEDEARQFFEDLEDAKDQAITEVAEWLEDIASGEFL